MSETYQTIIYDRPSGSILKVAQNFYVSSKSHLASAVSRPHWKDLAFLYFPHDLPINPSVHHVKRLTPNAPPVLVAADGIPIDFSVIIQSRRKRLLQGATCLVEFEGGMGDQLMEAAAVLTAIDTYKHSSFSIRCANHYVDILRRIPGIPQVESSYVGESKQQFTFVISNHTQHISDPRGGMFGKASLYGAWLGLDRVDRVAQIKLTRSDYDSESAFFLPLLPDKPRLNFMCQFRSGSGHAKSWQYEKVLELSRRLSDHYPTTFFIVGAKNEVPKGLPDVIDLTGQSTWWQTCLLESHMDLVFCIDSGVMHLARSLRIPYIALWGGTNAQTILGEEEQPHDIRLDLPCRDLICYDCQNKTNACMEKITPNMVLKNAKVLLDHAPKKRPGR